MPFTTFGLDPRLLEALKDLNFTQPTPIQKMAIGPLMEGRDALAAAATGSGKTAAFLLPILHKLLDRPRGTTRALVLAPTRELAAQIAEHLKELAVHTKLKGAAVYGGVGMQPQVHAFQKGVDVLIATPGRLLDHFQYPYAKLDGLEFLVLDEADRMLDMGFLPDVRRVLKHIPSVKQTLLFSATLPDPIVQLSREMLKDPVALNVERKSAPAAGITHAVYPVPHELKSHLFLALLKRPEFESILVFTRTKHRANRLADFLQKRGVSCARIHGGRSQAQRTEALAGFKAGKFRILVATDIAARGIDVEALGLVVNFDVPNVPDDYIHRVGRTARAELTGDAITLVSPQEEPDLAAIEHHMGKRLPREKVEGFDYAHKTEEKLEIPLAERIAAIRARKAEERARAKAKAERRAQQESAAPSAAASRDRKRDRPKGPRPPQASRPAGTPPSDGRGNRGPRPQAAHAGPHARPTAAPGHAPHGPARGPRPDRDPNRTQPGWHPRGPHLPAAGDEESRGNRIDGSPRPHGAAPQNRPPGGPRRDDRRPDRGQRPRTDRPQEVLPPSPRSGGFSFIRSSRFVDDGQPHATADTSGVREDLNRSHKHEVGGKSNWGKTWQEKAKSGWKPTDAEPEE